MGYFQVMMKGRNSVHGSRHLRPSWGDFTQPFRVSWLCWWCVAQGGRSLSNPQPPTSLANVDPDRLYQTWWWVPPHSITWRHVRFLRLHPADGVHLQPPYHSSVVQAAESTSRPLHCLGHNALFCCPTPTQGPCRHGCTRPRRWAAWAYDVRHVRHIRTGEDTSTEADSCDAVVSGL